MIKNSFRSLGREFLRDFNGNTKIPVCMKHSSNNSRFSPKFEPLKSKILANTEISINHLTPEIRLRLITPACAIYHQTIDDNFVFKNSDPFWGFYWAGGQGMSRYILDHPEVVRDKLVLDFGSGSGVCAIASMMSGASKAVANDIDEVAEVAAILNAELNNVDIDTETKNLIGNRTTFQFDVIILGDVFYDEEIAGALIPWLQILFKQRKTILIGDPGRHPMPHKRHLTMLAKYLLPANVSIENNGFTHANVWKFEFKSC